VLARRRVLLLLLLRVMLLSLLLTLLLSSLLRDAPQAVEGIAQPARGCVPPATRTRHRHRPAVAVLPPLLPLHRWRAKVQPLRHPIVLSQRLQLPAGLLEARATAGHGHWGLQGVFALLLSVLALPARQHAGHVCHSL
jgi:hypothetical protein